eukprot:PhM_4_TR18776/c0_g1_i1/m.58806
MMRRSLRRLFHIDMGEPTAGKVHPDVHYGFMQRTYRGPGWMHKFKMLPAQTFLQPGGMGFSNHYDRQGPLPDPEDPRHPVVRLTNAGETMGADGSVRCLIHGSFGPIPQSSRLLQVLYENYLEPFTMHRICGQLNFFGKVPTWFDQLVFDTTEYMGNTVSVVGNVWVSNACAVMEGVTATAGLNDIYLGESSQIHENVCFVTDQPTTLHHYQRDEAINPYQTMEMSEGMIKIGPNAVIEPNCLIESCDVGACTRIGHNSKIMKGVQIGILSFILPGSVVVADTAIGDGEIWGGAPATKLGKVSKFEWKRPYNHSMLHREQIVHAYNEMSRWGDQSVEYAVEMDNIDTMLVKYEDEIPEGVKAQIRDFVEGREPFHHMVARMTQGWGPANRTDDKTGDCTVPLPSFNYHVKHNDDTYGGRYAGSPLSEYGTAWVRNGR